MMAWCYSFQGKMETAKKYCYQAIKIDPKFGDAYNDLGSYFIQEGKFKEGLKWLKLAKTSDKIMHREFPYVNTAKAHLAMKNYKKALHEFDLALSFIPYPSELKTQIEKIKSKIQIHVKKEDSSHETQ
jgi:Tfp pilus assembly protein PilF